MLGKQRKMKRLAATILMPLRKLLEFEEEVRNCLRKWWVLCGDKSYLNTGHMYYVVMLTNQIILMHKFL
jgi:hypothetical protein